MFRHGLVAVYRHVSGWHAPTVVGLAIVFSVQVWCTSVGATNFAVTNPGDDGSPGTLRWAIEQANAAGAGTHTISFSVPANSIIELTDDLPQLDNSAATVELDGIGAGGVTISGHNNHRVLFVAAGNWYVRNFNINNGLAAGGDGGSGGGGGGLGAGGAVLVNSGASLTIRNVNFNGNNANGGDGGLHSGSVGGGGGGGLGGDGGNATSNGGGGGGGAGIFASGGDGSSLAGGGGGGLILPGLPGVGPVGGLGAPLGGNGGSVFQSGQGGATFGGGGGGGLDGGGGAGGTFGGGGGASAGGGIVAGNGGFGGGGGGAGPGGTAGVGGFGAGDGGAGIAGQGGSGFGGAIFVRQGGTFNIENSNTTNNDVAAGSNPADNTAAGQDLYLMQGVTATFQNTANNTNSYSGSIAGEGALSVANGLTILGGTNTYEGGTAVLGGILEGTTDSLQGAISNDATVRFNQNFSGSFFGSITGAGQLIKYGLGNVTLTDPNAFNGGTLISFGTLTATTANLQGSVTNEALFALDQNFDGTYFGAITGVGELIKYGDGIVTLANIGNSQSIISIEGGALAGTTSSLNAPSITNFSTLIYDQAFNSSTSSVITGTGNIFKTGAGSVSVTSTGNQASRIDILAGRFAVNGDFTTDVWVDTPGVLGGSGEIIGNVHNFGTVAAGNSIGTLTVTGDYSVAAGATHEVEINAAGTTPGVNNDLVEVGGTATLQGGTVDVQVAAGSYSEGATYRFLSADSIVGQFSGITFSGLGPNLHAVLGYDVFGGQDWAYFTLFDSQTNFLANAETYNERQVAIYLDDNSATATGQFQATLDQMQLLAPSGQRQAMNELTGVVNGTIAQLGVQDTTFLYQMLRRRVGSAFAAGGLVNNGNSSDWTTDASHPAERLILPCDYKRSSKVTIMSTSASSSQSPWAGWTTGYGFGGSAQSDGNAAGGTFGSGGTIFAVERALDSSTLVGLFGAYSHLGLSLSGLPQSASANQGLFGGYLLKDFDRGYMLAAGSAGFAGYKETRQMAFGNVNETATGNYDGWNPTSYLEFGRRYAHGSTTFQPYVATQYVYVRQNGFTETGAGDLNQQVNGIDTHALRGLLGARASQVWQTSGGQTWVPELRAVWMHEFLDPTTTLTAIFAPVGGSSFATRGLDFGRDWAILGGGTQYVMSQNVSLFANYDLLVNGQQVWNAGSGGLQFSW